MMQETEKLEKVVKMIITAGYQLNKDAFDLLDMLLATDDPETVVSKVIRKTNKLDEKPYFLDRRFVETLLEEPEPREEISENSLRIQPKVSKSLVAGNELSEGSGSKRQFISFAKEVKSEFKVIEDTGTKLSSNGTLNDYVKYFRDRFTKVNRLLRQRMDVKSAGSIVDALKSQPSTRLKIIGMIAEKREVKQKIILKIEDLRANMTAIVPQNAPEEILRKAHTLLLDQVVCLEVVKTRGNLLIVEDIIFPDVPQRTPHKASIPVYAVLTSDMHVGSNKFQKEAFNRFVLWLNGKYGNDEMREIASHVKYVVVAGDIVDGIGIYPNQIKELAIKDINRQYRLAARYFEQIPEYIDVIVTPGNHDSPRKALPQPAISKKLLSALQESRPIYSLGSPCLISLHGVEILVYHGRSIDDINSTISGMDNNHPERAMKLLLQGRHLAPVYGGKTLLSPENKDSLVIERIPDIFHAGHIHALGHMSYRGVLLVNSGGWQEQTDYMQKLGFTPTPSKVPVVNLQSLELTVLPFN
jgi:DNA polymerase II small subunit